MSWCDGWTQAAHRLQFILRVQLPSGSTAMLTLGAAGVGERRRDHDRVVRRSPARRGALAAARAGEPHGRLCVPSRNASSTTRRWSGRASRAAAARPRSGLPPSAGSAASAGVCDHTRRPAGSVAPRWSVLPRRADRQPRSSRVGRAMPLPPVRLARISSKEPGIGRRGCTVPVGRAHPAPARAVRHERDRHGDHVVAGHCRP